MRHTSITVMLLVLTWYGTSFAQNRKYMPIPPAAAQFIAARPRAESVDDIQTNYLAAPLGLREGVETILVEGRGNWACGAANCQSWVLEKQGKTYRLLLDAHSIQQTHVLNSVTNGYHDIQTDMHGSAFLSAIAIYKYDGRQYRLSDCFSKEYQVDVDEKGEERVKKEPVITRTCGR